MKKLIYVFVVLFVLGMITGCGARQNTIRYNNGNEVTEDSEATDDTINGDIEETENADETTDTDSEAVNTDSEEVKAVDEVKAVIAPTGKLAVTSFDGAYLKTNLSYNVVKGTLPTGTHKVTINDYVLSKYIAGQTEWDYIASTRFSTLKDGLNTYTIKTYDAEGEQTDSLIFSIDYTAPSVPEALPSVGANHWLTLMMSLLVATSYAILRRLKWL